MAERNVDAFAARLGDPNLEIRLKVQIATELRDSIEYMSQGPAYPVFLQKMVPIFMKLLEGEPRFMSHSMEQRLRNCVLEILHRLPFNPPDALEPYSADIVDMMMNLVKIENEDNAVLCMKTIMDFQRHQPKALGTRVQPFLDLIKEMFQTMEKAVNDTFNKDVATTGPGAGHPSTPSNASNFQSPHPGSPIALVSDLAVEQQASRPLLKGMQSFKVLAECPIIVVSLLQAHRHTVNKHVSVFVPLIKSVLMLQAAPQAQAHEEAKRQGTIFTGVSPKIKNRAAFGEFITAQVKTMSFLAYLLRAFASQLNSFLHHLPVIVVRLLRDCPREKSGARKELLVAIRHIINFNFRKVFLSQINELLDERTLIGDGLTVYETMRPLAFSMLADLIHHVRDSLDKEQLRRTIVVYTKNLHDDYPGTSFQTMSAKLLLNLAERIANLPDKKEARHFLIMILDAIGDKFAAMNRQYPNAKKLTEQYRSHSIDAAPEDYLANRDKPPDWDETDIFNATPIKTSNPRDRSSDPLTDNRFLFKNLMNGLRNMFYQLKACNPQPQPISEANTPANWHEVTYGYNAEEVKVITKLFREGAHVFRYYSVDKSPSDAPYSTPVEFLANSYMMSSGKDEKDLLETFATVFHCIDPATFHEVFHSEIPRLYDMMFEHTALLHVPQFFLASEATSPSFAGMLLQFLMGRIDEVGSSDVQKSSILLRLFKLSFMAVTLFSNQNEQVLLPHVTKIVTKSIQLSTTAEEPMNYFLLLRSLFRSIGGGRFELLYKEILPLLEMLLEVLNNLLVAARKPQERDLYVELCLTVPARLSNLLPHLSYLMRPLVVALRAGSELVGQGLRTLELCVDNLTADYLDPIMAPVMQELMTALWDHLRPTPYPHFHSHTTMRILGKLGGRNRKFLTEAPELDFRQYADDESSFDIRLNGSNKDRAFPATIGVDLAIGKLMSVPKSAADRKSDPFYKRQAFRLISTQVKLHLGVDALPDDFAQLVRLQAKDLLEANFDVPSDLYDRSERDKSVAKKDVQSDMLKKLFKAVLFASSIKDLEADADSLAEDICRHLTVLEVGRSLAQVKHLRRPFDVELGEGPLYLDHKVFVDAIVESLSSDVPSVRDAAEKAMEHVRDAAAVIFDSAEKVDKLPFFLQLSKAFCHSCYEEEWFTKAGGSKGIHLFATSIDLGDAWVAERQIEYVRALMYVMKDMPQDLPAQTRVQAQETLEVLLRRCNKAASKGDMSVANSKLSNLCGYLIYELGHMNSHVRTASQKAFAIIAESVGLEVHELMAPVKDRLLSPIYMKPLRALPFAIQIGYIDAVTFCLGLQHDIVEFSEQMNRLLMESLALADADDESLAAKPTEQRTAESIVNLRVSCIKLLSMAMGFQEFGSGPQNQSRAKIISVFFKSLYSKSPEVIEAANTGLKGVLTVQNKLPKDLLQNGLRPILMNLQDPKRLTVAGLDGLARLLTLLTNYFKVEIGQRLLAHMDTIAEANSLQKISFTLVEQNHQMKVIAAIFNVFHLLPVAAVCFLEDLINKVLKLEEALRRTRYSPFREPLIKYLNQYPKQTWDFFSTRMHEMRYGRFLAQILADPSSGAVRDVVKENVDEFLTSSLALEDETQRLSGIVNGIHVVHSIIIQPESSDWLVTANDALRQKLVSAGRELQMKQRKDAVPCSFRLPAEQAGEQLMEILTGYMVHAPNNIDFLFEIIDATTAEELKSCYPLFRHIYQHIVTSDSVDHWKSLILRCLDLSHARTTSQRTKTFVFHYLVNPIFAMDIMRTFNRPPADANEPRLMDKSMTEAVHSKVWKPHLTDYNDDPAQPGLDHSRMELLQMSALLIKYHHNLILDVRKDIIKFGWTSIRLEDIINKQAAYVVIGYFIAHYETPPKIVIQVYVALLRAHQNEGRSLVTQALELIAGVLPKRVAAAADSRLMPWAKWPKKVMMEEHSNLQQLMSIFHFLVRHPALFYDAREQFIPSIIQSLGKIAALPDVNLLGKATPPAHPSRDSKTLVLNLIALIWQWEERRIQGTGPAARSLSQSQSPQSRKRRADGSQVELGSPPSTRVPPPLSQTSTTLPDRADYIIPDPLKLALIKYLVHMIATLPERCLTASGELKETTNQAPTTTTTASAAAAATTAATAGTTATQQQQQQQQPPMIKKSLTLLSDLLSPDVWSNMELELFPKLLEPILASKNFEIPEKDDKPDEKLITNIVNSLQVLVVIVNGQSDERIVERLPVLQKLLEKPVRSADPEIQDCLHTVGGVLTRLPHIQPLLQRIIRAIPEESADEEDPDTEVPTSEFITFLSAAATETLSVGNHVSSINTLWTLSRQRPTKMDEHITHIMKALSQKLARDHVAAFGAGSGLGATQAPTLRPGEVAAPGVLGVYDREIQTDLIIKTIDLIALRMSVLGEQRRPFLSVLASLVEKSQSTKLCLKVLAMVDEWVFESKEVFPTLKEKTAVLSKMLLFESRPDPTFLVKFLDLVIRIYEDQKITRTELTVRLEHAFLIGTRAQDVDVRNRFMAIFDRSLTRSASARLDYVISSQNWDTLAESFWISQAIQLMFGSVEMNMPAQLHADDVRVIPASSIYASYGKDSRKDDLMLDDKFDELIVKEKRFCAQLSDVKVRDVLEPLTQLQHLDDTVAHQIWIRLFPICWSALTRDDRVELERGMVALLTKDYHQRQADRRPNVVQTLLEGTARAKPLFKVPPHVLKFLSRTYDAWYVSLCTLEEAAITPVMESSTVRESNMDALIELYAGLQEEDLFYGTWRRRCQFVETNAALSYEQHGMWDKAQQMYEHAQVKARTGTLPFSQGEYMLWEDHWVSCAQKLQQWDILHDFAKHENFNDLLLECSWRHIELWNGSDQRDWLDGLVKGVMDAPTPRRSFFQAFMTLLKLHSKTETLGDFNRVCDESVQLSIRKWHQLPKGITNAHIPILQNFQQLVELHDASVICSSLNQTNQQNLDGKSQELKLLLGTWRDRLPNVWDDINAWQDLVTWRQHIFSIINATYLTLLPQPANSATGGNSYAYRGYHETAWIINRFAHVARKHQLPDVCINQLSRIYTLPNIEIQEAFLKLREQAKCHYQNKSELNSGLDVINNTNLNYFGAQQKAEFFTLKGMFLAKLEHTDDANDAFGTALYYDIKLPKAWAEWGHYNDDNMKQHPNDMKHAVQAVSCYLEAAGLFKNAKSRKLLSRVLWILSLDNAEGVVAKAFDEYRGDTPVWYWITFIPQLLTSLSNKEARISKSILVKIAQMFPQALYFQLRTCREDMLSIKKSHDLKTNRGGSGKQGQASPAAIKGSNSNGGGGSGGAAATTTSPAKSGSVEKKTKEEAAAAASASNGATKDIKTEATNGVSQGSPNGVDKQAVSAAKKYPWEYTEEIMAVLKTAFPLLALSIETMVDQIQKNFKCPPDEDAYRLIVALLNDGLSYVGRAPASYAPDGKLPQATEANITRFAETILPAHIRRSFEADFVKKKPTVYEYIHKLRRWRDRFEEKLDRRPPYQSLENFSPHLSEFRFQKFDEVEVPGQYLQHKDKNQDFVRIERFMPNVDVVRGIGICHRRLKIRGQDGSVHPFAIQHPAARYCRREERILQLFRTFNGVLAKRKESRRRNLNFHLPLMVPLAPHIRLVQDDASYISLQGVYEDHCRRHGMDKDEPILFAMDRLKALIGDAKSQAFVEKSSSLRMEVFAAIQERSVPANIALEHFQSTHSSFASFWLFRRQFTYSFAALTFMTYMMHMDKRYPHKMSIARATGNVWGSELIPAMAQPKAVFHNSEAVPIRLTPNLQTLIGPMGSEGILSGALMVLARCLTEPEFELEQTLSIFVRDEMIFWLTQQQRAAGHDGAQLRDSVQQNSDIIVNRTSSLAHPPKGHLPANQTAIDLCARASKPTNLAQVEALWMPYL